MSIIDPLSFGFAKIAAFTIFTEKHNVKKAGNEADRELQGKILQERYRKYKEYFDVDNNENLSVDYKQFTHNFPKIVNHIRKLNKRQMATKNMLLKTFSKDKWTALSEKKKKKTHNLSNCKGCFTDKELKVSLSKFPIYDIKFKAKANKEEVLSDVTNQVVERLNSELQEKYNTKFTTQAKQYFPAFHTPNTKDIRAFGKSLVKDIENQYTETSVERYVGQIKIKGM